MVTLPDVIALLVVQPTPFCNINCDYCYLPDRDSTARMVPAVFSELLRQVFASGLAGRELSVIWHAGEPLVLPVDYYSAMLGVIDELRIERSRFRHSIQTNGLLISDAWCRFIRDNDFHIGISVDGPAFIHDRHRKDRQGKGTHDRVVRGMERLHDHGIEFHAIAVVTADSLDFADEIIQFFVDNGVQRIGFNIDEQEGENRRSSLVNPRLETRIRKFWARLYELQQSHEGLIHIREFESAYAAIMRSPVWLNADVAMGNNSQVSPLRILTVDWSGNLYTFSPELAGLKSVPYTDFCIGNICRDSLPDLVRSEKLRRLTEDIRAGVKMCAEACEYFGLCGGGAPSNKYYENGLFASAETAYCRATIQMPVDVVLADMETLTKSASNTATFAAYSNIP